MRMWNIPPLLLCDQHLRGEHFEMHMFVGSINKGVSIEGFITKGLVDTRLIASRHDALAKEMGIRKMNHDSPLIYEDKINRGSVGEVDSLCELASRCAACRQRIILYGQVRPNRLPALRSSNA